MPNLRSSSREDLGEKKDDKDPGEEEEIKESTSGPGGVAVGCRHNPKRGATNETLVEDESDDSYSDGQRSPKRLRTRSPGKGTHAGLPRTKAAAAKEKTGKNSPKRVAAKRPKAKTTQESKKNVRGAAIGEALQKEMEKKRRMRLEKNYRGRLLTAWTNCLKQVQLNTHAADDENFDFVGNIDLRSITSAGGNQATKKKERLLAYREFQEAFPAEWDEFMCADGQEGSFGEFVFAPDEEKEKYYIPKVHKKVYRNRVNLVEAVAGVDLKLAMIVKNLSPHIMVSLSQMYGDVEEGGYTHKFVQNSIAIHFCRDDNRLYGLFQEEEKVQRRAALKASKNKAPPEWVYEELALVSEDLFKKSKLRGIEEEERMKSEGGVLGGGPDPNMGEHSDADNGPKNMTAFVQKATRIARKHLEKAPQGEDKEGKRKRSFSSLYKASRKSKGGWEAVDEFYDGVNLDPTFMTSKRATYMMDSQFVSKEARMGGRSGDFMQPDDMNKAGVSSADSSLHSKAGRNAHLLLTDVVAKAIFTAVTESYEDTEGPDECELTDGPDVDVDKKGLMHEYRESLQDKLTKKSWETCNLHTGTIRQCINPLHQQLHLDNNLSLQDKTVKSIMMQENLEPEEWVNVGYVVDLPLSREGLWLRVGIPDAKNSTVFMHWVYVPYGSMLIRSMALLHGGHYGSPGNCRFHGTFMVDGQNLDSKKLAYLSRMRPDVLCDLSDWKLRWSPNIPRLAWPENGFRALTCKEWQTGMRVGTQYYHNSIEPLMPHPFAQNCLKNLNPYTTLTGIDERTSKVNFIWDSRNPEAVNVAVAADLEERRRIAKLLMGFGAGYVPGEVEEHEESDPGEHEENDPGEGADEDQADAEADAEVDAEANNEAQVEADNYEAQVVFDEGDIADEQGEESN